MYIGEVGLGHLTSRDLRSEDHGRWVLTPSHPKLIKAFDVGVLSLMQSLKEIL